MFGWLRRIGRSSGDGSRVTGDASQAREALIRELSQERDYWRRIAERLIDEGLREKRGEAAPALFHLPATKAGTPFAELFSAMVADRVGYPHDDRSDRTV